MSAELEGYIDIIEFRHIYGWVWSPNNTEKKLEVDMYFDDKYFDSVSADIRRGDLIEASKGDGYHGFFYKIPHMFSDSKNHSLSIRVDEFNYTLLEEFKFSYVGEER